MKLPIEFGRPVCGDPGEACSREWLETNGIGGFACSTLPGLNTRRYHALLTAATNPPAGRVVLLSKVEEVLVRGDQRFELSANRYGEVIHPRGFEHLGSFRLDPFPRARYRCDDMELEKTVFLMQGENTAVIQYRLIGDPGAHGWVLEIRPLIAFRDYHGTSHANDSIDRNVAVRDGMAVIHPYQGLPSLHFGHNAASVDPSGGWFYNFAYDRERERGLDFTEDLYNPFLLRFHLTGDAPAVIVASTMERAAAEFAALRSARLRAVPRSKRPRRWTIRSPRCSPPRPTSTLSRAAIRSP